MTSHPHGPGTDFRTCFGAAGAVELWSHYYWNHPIGIGSRLILVAVVVTLFAAVYMQTRLQ